MAFTHAQTEIPAPCLPPHGSCNLAKGQGQVFLSDPSGPAVSMTALALVRVGKGADREQK